MLLTGLLTAGVGLALVVGIGRVLIDLKSSKRNRPLAPWEREDPPTL